MAAAGGMHNLTTLIKRLEAATSRLEDLASTAQPPDSAQSLQTPTPTATSSLIPITSNASTVTPTQSESAIKSPAVQAFDSMVMDDMKPFSELSNKLGDLVAEQGAAFCRAFRAQRQVLVIASKSKEPDIASPVYLEILRDLQQEMEVVNNVREQNRKTPQENQLAMLAEGVSMLAWVTIKPNPEKYVGEVLGGAQLYGNRVLTSFKDRDSPDVEWVRSFVKLAGSLVQFIKQFFSPQGLKWNKDGTSPEEALQEVKNDAPIVNGSSASPPPTDQSGPPPPPPLPPPLDASSGTSVAATGAAAGDMGAVFQQLNRGEEVTSGLRKVDKSEMTHKNPSLRAAPVVVGAVPVPQRSSSSSSTRSKSPLPNKKPDSMRAKKPPKKELDGNKWNIENFDNEGAPVELTAEKHQSVLISRCKATTVRITGKANAISIDNCARLDLLVDNLVGAVDVIKTQNFRMQIVGACPSVQLDQVDGATVFLSPQSLATELLTSKCTAVNVTVPPANDHDDSVEMPVPEQIRSVVRDGRLLSEIVRQDG